MKIILYILYGICVYCAILLLASGITYSIVDSYYRAKSKYVNDKNSK